MHRNLRRLLEPANPLDRFGRFHRQADAANARRDWAAAEAGYAGALRIDPLRDELWVQYGHALKEQGRLEAAAQAYGTAVRLAPRSADASLQAGLALDQLGRHAAAVEALRAALAEEPGLLAARQTLDRLGDRTPVDAAPPQPYRDVADLPVRVAEQALRPRGRDAAWPDPRRLPAHLARGSRPAPIVFFHLHKTGGLTLDDVIGAKVPPARVCPVKDDRLHVFERAALDRFDLFSGHCDVGALALIGRPVRTVSLFREPRARLISFYRFHRGHDLSGRHGVNTFAQLANALSPEAFFEHDEVRRAPEVFNHYLTVFSLTYHQVRTSGPAAVGRVTPDLVDRAVARVRGLDAVGLLERFDDSVALCCSSLGLPVPRTVKPLNGADAIARQMRRPAVPPVAMTPRLAAALADLVRFDDPIYAAATQEFERRFAATAPTARS